MNLSTGFFIYEIKEDNYKPNTFAFFCMNVYASS